MKQHRWTRSMVAPGLLAAGLTLLSGCEPRSEAGPLATARQQIAAREPANAIITLKAALQKQPDLAAARHLLGQTLLETGEAKAAVSELKRALALGHDVNVTVPSLARALMADGQAAEVLSTLSNQQLGSAAAQADLLTSVARAQVAQGQRDAAEQTLLKAVAAEPTYAPARLLQARLKVLRGDRAGALAQVQSLLAADSNSAAPWVLQAELLLQPPADAASAAAAFGRALSLEPKNLVALAGQVRLALASPKPDTAQAPLAALEAAWPRHPVTHELQAQLALSTNRPADAREATQQWLRLTPEDPRALLIAGDVEWRLGARVPAQTYLRKAMANAPDSAQASAARLLLAQTQLTGGEAAGALQTLAPLLQATAPPAEVLGLAARAHLQLGQAAQARALFARAGKAQPQNLQYRLAVLLGELDTAKDRQARTQLEALAESDTSGQAAQALASVRLSRRDFAGALAALDRAQRQQPANASLWLLRAQVHQAQGDEAKARAAYAQALETDPQNVEAAVRLSERDVAEGQAVAGLARVRSLLARQPRDVPLLLTYAQLQERAGARRSEVRATLEEAVVATTTDVGPSLALVRHFLAEGSHRQALSAAQAAVAAFPADPQVTEALGQAQLAAGEAQQAIRSFKQVAAARPGQAEVMLQLARAHRAAGQGGAAVALLEELLKQHPTFRPAQRVRIELAMDQQQWATAMALSQAQQQREPGRPEGWFWQAGVHGAQRQWDKAAAALRQALAKGGGTEVAVRLLSSLRAQGQMAEADRFAAQWLQQNPRDTVLRMALADLAGRAGDLPGAEQQYRAVLDIAPEHAAAMNNLAWVLARQRKPGALALAERANQLHPGQPELMDTWATALAAERQTAKAIQVLQAAIKQAPEQPGLWLNLAEVALQDGDKYLARTQLTRLRDLGDRFADQARVAELLKSAQ